MYKIFLILLICTSTLANDCKNSLTFIIEKTSSLTCEWSAATCGMDEMYMDIINHRDIICLDSQYGPCLYEISINPDTKHIQYSCGPVR